MKSYTVKYLFLICITSLLFSCFKKEDEKIPVINGQVINGNNQQLYLYQNNKNKVLIDTIKINSEGKFSVYQENIDTIGFYILESNKGDVINMFLEPYDFIQLTFDYNDVVNSCNSSNSKLLNAFWSIEKNTRTYSAELQEVIVQFQTLIGKEYNDSIYQHFYNQKDSITKIFKAKSINITKGIDNPVITYLMLQQKAGNNSIFSLVDDLDLFIKNDEELISDKKLKPLFEAYDKNLMRAYSSIRAYQRYDAGGQFPVLKARTKWDEELDISKINGKIIHVIYWDANAENDDPKIKEIKNLMREYGRRGLKTLMIAYQTDKQLWQSKVKQLNLPYWHLIDTMETKSADLAEMGIRTLPHNMIINAEGVILERNLWGKNLQKSVDNFIKKY